MESEFWMWRDTIDHSSFMLAVQLKNEKRTSYTTWTTLFSDGINDLFGHEFYAECMAQPVGVPFKVRCTLSIGDDQSQQSS